MRNLLFLIFAAGVFITNASGQTIHRELSIAGGATVEIVNRYGRVDVSTIGTAPGAGEKTVFKAELTAVSKTAIADNELNVEGSGGRIRIEPNPTNSRNRIDITLAVPERTRLKIETLDGEVRVSGNLESVEVMTATGTIAADIPTDDVRYEMLWTSSRPRFLSDFELEKVKEKSAGRFSIKGRFEADEEKRKRGEEEKGSSGDAGTRGSVDENAEPPVVAGGSTNGDTGSDKQSSNQKPPPGSPLAKVISLKFTTARGIILLNVPPNEVMSDLRERPLTNAAKAIIRSGDSLLMDAIRRASPKYFGEYARTLPPMRREPVMTTMTAAADVKASSVRIATVRVTDLQNRAISGLNAGDFDITESSVPREIVSVQPTIAPVNLVLLLDVSGSVDSYVNFIRKAARAFVETVGVRDRVSIVLFNEDVKTLAAFTTDKGKLSESLDTFDAGGGTAYYDAIAYTLTETLRPLQGERTAIVVLTDGDDNRSFLPLNSLLGSIEESGALIYPLYVPSSLVAASLAADSNAAVDPLRSRYLSNDLTSKADGEGKQLAKVSGGVYYPITQLSQIQTAYEDIVVQLRTAYDITFRSEVAGVDGKPSPRLKIRTKKPNTFVQVRTVRTSRNR